VADKKLKPDKLSANTKLKSQDPNDLLGSWPISGVGFLGKSIYRVYKKMDNIADQIVLNYRSPVVARIEFEFQKILSLQIKFTNFTDRHIVEKNYENGFGGVSPFGHQPGLKKNLALPKLCARALGGVEQVLADYRVFGLTMNPKVKLARLGSQYSSRVVNALGQVAINAVLIHSRLIAEQIH
jgi:hypothetical protein